MRLGRCLVKVHLLSLVGVVLLRALTTSLPAPGVLGPRICREIFREYAYGQDCLHRG